MNTSRICAALIMVAAISACTTQPDEPSAPPPGAAASVEKVSQRLDDLVVPEAPYADPAPPCGQGDSRSQWPIELPVYRAQLDAGNDVADFFIYATVWPNEDEAEAAANSYVRAVDDCPDAIENDGHETEFGDVVTTTDVTPGWHGVKTTLDGGFTNHSATSGDYIKITSTVRKESLMVELRWSHLLSWDSDEDEEVHRERADEAHGLIDDVLERLAVPSETGRTVDDRALSVQASAALDAQQHLPDVQPTSFPSRDLACTFGDEAGSAGDPLLWLLGHNEPGESDVFSGSVLAHRAWITADTESTSAMSVNQRIVIAGNADIEQIHARHPTRFNSRGPCDGRSDVAYNDDGDAYATGPCTSKEYLDTDTPYTESGWDGTIFARGARCHLGADAPVGKSVVDVTAIVQHGPILVCLKVQTGGGADLDAAAETATEAIIAMIEAIPVD